MKTLLISGVSGQVGKHLTKLSQEFGFYVVCGVDKHPFIDVNFPIFKTFSEVKNDVDVIIDFSSPELGDSAVDFALERRIKLVCGTTALSNETLKKIQLLSQKIAVCLSSNFSIGIPAYSQAVSLLVKSLTGFDVSMTEIHNSKKKDHPSGTAKSVCKQNSIKNVFSIRGGSVSGVHKTLFLGNGEEIEITHRAYDKSIFARGALNCAVQILQKEKGLFNSQMLPISHLDLLS